ncbi:translation elongation factor Ts [Leucothrix arctica]|uniref:Elongation factor Ts n=1 Tax=Leucothrix arctica TaxID=1481894 RepID=A0A317CP35_9GAMM|nr:translation elongation factor Ts [Leucothrix arctica]PWQ98100.1 elongation factor Ts [Leucothrix arctica]
MAISAAQVKELRQRTGAGMMDCKKMLTETDGDMEAAIDLMRKSGAAKADKKAGRIAAEGRVVIVLSDDKKEGAIVEVNSETDFVAKDSNFIEFAEEVAATTLADKPADVAALSELPLASGETITEVRTTLVGKIGENIKVRRFELLAADADSEISFYQHGEKIGVAVVLKNGNDALGKDIAMHIAASRPVCVSEAEVPAEVLEREKAILIAQAQESGKPMEIIEKMIQGRLRKYLAEITLLGQAFVKDADQTVEQLLKASGAEVTSFVRFEVGEGIEKVEEDFAAEVMAQVNQAG